MVLSGGDLERRAGDNSGDQNLELGQENRPTDFGESRPTKQVTERGQAESENSVLWKPEDPVNTGGFGPSDRTPGQDRIGSENDACSSRYRHTLGAIYRQCECNIEGLSTGDQRYLREPIRTSLDQNQEEL